MPGASASKAATSSVLPLSAASATASLSPKPSSVTAATAASSPKPSASTAASSVVSASAAGDSDTKSPPSVKSDARSGVGAEVAVIAAAIAMATDLLSVFKSFFIHFPP